MCSPWRQPLRHDVVDQVRWTRKLHLYDVEREKEKKVNNLFWSKQRLTMKRPIVLKRVWKQRAARTQALHGAINYYRAIPKDTTPWDWKQVRVSASRHELEALSWSPLVPVQVSKKKLENLECIWLSDRLAFILAQSGPDLSLTEVGARWSKKHHWRALKVIRSEFEEFSWGLSPPPRSQSDEMRIKEWITQIWVTINHQ